MNVHEKYEELKRIIKSYESMAVAFSGGVDSSFLLYTAKEVLGDRVLALTAASSSFPERERAEAEAFCRDRGIRQITVESSELEIEGFRDNPPDRCYLCKHHLFGKLLEVASQEGLSCLAEGSNMDDNGDYRPGMKAIAELGIRSPLREAGLFKEEIRLLSRESGLPTWDKPSFACLASRFVYGEKITEKKLDMVDRAEQLLLDLGFRQVRVRIHGENAIARIEILPEEFERLFVSGHRERIVSTFRSIGFKYITLDLTGYRTGSMNETLS